MQEFEFYKVAGWVLTALLVIFGMRTYFNSHEGGEPEKPGYVLVTASKGDAKEASAEAKPEAGKSDAAGGEDIKVLLTKADAANGKALFKKCQACHVAEKGKTPTVGPNLWDVVNRAKGTYPGYGYSPAMASKGGNWTFEDLAQFIRNPKAFVSGTKMQFNGYASPTDEADVIAYLATLADTPVPLPK